MLDGPVPPAMPVSAPPRQRLLEANGGCWEGLFHRLGPDGREIERFPTRLRVNDEDGTIEAALTYLPSGRTVPMRFREPPAAMEISTAGHWSLGMDRMAPGPGSPSSVSSTASVAGASCCAMAWRGSRASPTPGNSGPASPTAAPTRRWSP
jgi:hypothetical protein